MQNCAGEFAFACKINAFYTGGISAIYAGQFLFIRKKRLPFAERHATFYPCGGGRKVAPAAASALFPPPFVPARKNAAQF